MRDVTQIHGETELSAFAGLQLNCFPASVQFIGAVNSCHSTFTTLVQMQIYQQKGVFCCKKVLGSILMQVSFLNLHCSAE